MSSTHNHSRELRKLAEDFFAQLPPKDVTKLDLADLATSLVRQWITNDHVASIFLDENHHLYLSVGYTPLGQMQVIPQKASFGWGFELVEDWKVDPADFPDIFRQMNTGQGAEVVNTQGVTLRLWVDPKARTRGVEPLTPEPRPPTPQKDYLKIAFQAVRSELGDSVPAHELAPLAESVVRQWKQFKGQAVIFRDSKSFLHFQWSDLANGGGRLQVRVGQANLGENLTKCGVSSSDFPKIIADLNLGKPIDFRLKNGSQYRFWTDPVSPTNSGYNFTQLQSSPIAPRSAAANGVLQCPKCHAISLPLPGMAPRCLTCGWTKRSS